MNKNGDKRRNVNEMWVFPFLKYNPFSTHLTLLNSLEKSHFPALFYNWLV